MTEIGTVTQVGENHISRGSDPPTSQGGGAKRPPIFLGDPTYARSVWPTATKFVGK